MEVKIRQGNDMLDATIEMVDGVMVVSPKVVKFEPKDGDVVFVKGAFEHILIYKEETLEHIVSYVDLVNNKHISREVANAVHLENIVDLRPATEEEKKKLFDKLSEEGWEWKSDTKVLVKLKWRPKEGETYHTPWIFISNSASFFCDAIDWDDDEMDKELYERGWCFRSEEECQEFCSRLNEAINSVKP